MEWFDLLVVTRRFCFVCFQTAKECAAKSGQMPLCVTGKLTSDEDVKRILDETINKYGSLDILVNNAGVLELGSIENTSMEQFDRVFNINLR